MEKSKLDLPEEENEPQTELPPELESEAELPNEPKSEAQAEKPETEVVSESQPEPRPEPQPSAETESYVNERIKKAYDKAKLFFKGLGNRYQQAPRVQKVTYQGKFLPAFWTVACIFSLIVNIILIAILISVGHNLFQLKDLLSKGIAGASNSLEMMDKAHIVDTVPVETTVKLQGNLPVVFDLQINQNTQLALAKETRITNAYIILNNTAVVTDLTLPANTPLLTEFDITIPISTTAPVNLNAPISMNVPIDIAVDKTDLHQSILGLQSAIEPYQTVMGSTFNSPNEFSMCNFWLTGWLCNLFFGK